jgi:hypothetical protein
MDRKQGHELDFRENHKNHPQFVQNPYMQTPIDTPYITLDALAECGGESSFLRESLVESDEGLPNVSTIPELWSRL